VPRAGTDTAPTIDSLTGRERDALAQAKAEYRSLRNRFSTRTTP
jgi:hypothetical protein